MPINLKQIRYLVKIVELGNMTSAAQALGIAQPALGAQIRQLELELQMPLLIRHSRGVSATKAGEFVAERGHRVLSDVEQMVRDLRSLHATEVDKLTFGISPTMVMLLGDRFLATAQQMMPTVALSLIEERTPGLIDALLQKQADIGFLFDIGHNSDLRRIAVLEEDLLLVSAPGANITNEPVSLSHALNHDLVMAGARGILRKIIASEATRLSLSLRITHEVHSITAMKSLVINGTASTIIPYSLAAEEIDCGQLIARKIERPHLTRVLYLVDHVSRSRVKKEEELQAFISQITSMYLNRTAPWTRSLSAKVSLQSAQKG